MIKKRGFKTYEEAVKEAEALLWKNRDGEELTTIEHTRKDNEGEPLPFAYIEDKETGATAYISSIFKEQGYNLIFLSGDEAKASNRTYPFRDVPKESIPFLMAIHTPIFKPTKEITPDEALSREGLRTIYNFFGEGDEDIVAGSGFLTKEEVEAQAYTIETAFEEWEKEDGTIVISSLLCLPLPKVLTELTGVKVKTPSDYAKGISKLLKAELTEEQERCAKSTFLFFASEALLRYAIYEFFRTEDYSHLKEVLSSFRKFHLSPKWEEEFTLYYGYRNIMDKELFTTEEYVIAKYLSKWNAEIIGKPNRLKDIAEYTGTPLSLMGKAYKIKHIWDF